MTVDLLRITKKRSQLQVARRFDCLPSQPLLNRDQSLLVHQSELRVIASGRYLKLQYQNATVRGKSEAEPEPEAIPRIRTFS